MIEKFCPSCQKAQAHRELFKKNDCLIFRCESCGLGTAIAEGFRPEQYYTSDYFDGGHGDGYVDYRGSEEVIRAESARMVKFLSRFCPGGRLLEIGCAYGFFLKEASARYEIHGIELADDAVKACHSTGLKSVRHGVADELTLAEIGPVDAIVLLDVIEHLPDPVETLRRCCNQLNPGGVILITTGDFASPMARLSGRNWRLMTPPQHLWFFTPRSFSQIAHSMNMEIVSHARPWKCVSLSLILFQLARTIRIKIEGATLARFSRFGVPVNLFDTTRLVLQKSIGKE